MSNDKSTDTSTDPYNGELPDDADLGHADDADPEKEDAVDDAAHLLPDGSGLAPDAPEF